MNTAFERAAEGKEEWLTPPEITMKLGPFDLDPCSPINRPWPTAAKHYTIEDDGLSQPWHGFVWCNPPYGTKTGDWLSAMALHNNGIALVFARTETQMFFDCVWSQASAMLFIKGRLRFYNVDGTPGPNSAGAPSVLVGYGPVAVERLGSCAIPGHFIINQNQTVAI